MKFKHPFPMSLPVVFGLAAVLSLSSCASFKLVSQRPPAGKPAVDATSAATDAEAPAQDPAAYKKPAPPAEASEDAVSSATSE